MFRAATCDMTYWAVDNDPPRPAFLLMRAPYLGEHFRHRVRSARLTTSMADWLDEFCLSPDFGPWYARPIEGGIETLYSFKNPKSAMAFKLVWG